MTDSLIFTLTDVRTVRKVSVNIDDFDQYAREVQTNYLQKILGDKLYTALQNDLVAGVPASPRFTELVDGVVYEDGYDVIFRGVKLYCCYLWLSVYMADSAISITPTGARLFKDENAEHNEAKKSYRNMETHFLAAADGLEEPITRFLTKKASVYPEYNQGSPVEQAGKDNITFKVIGNTTTYPDSKLW